MAASWGDFDGRQDLYVSNIYSKAGRHMTEQMAGLDLRLGRMARGSSLLRNGGDGAEQSGRRGSCGARRSDARLPRPAAAGTAPGTLSIYITTATWCDACKRSLPQLQVLRDALGSDVSLFGVPIDPDNDPEKIAAYVKKHRPAYRILSGLPEEFVDQVVGRVVEALDDEVLSSSIVTGADGHILATLDGVPSLSKVRELARTRP